MVARVGIFGAMLLSCITCASVLLRRVSAQTSPVSPQQQQVEDKPTKKERWTVAGVSAGVSLLGAALSFFLLSQKRDVKQADRRPNCDRFESQKVLLEINKQYL